MMTIDIILPTFNRSALLARTLESVRVARRPEGLRVRVLVVDNASTDATAAVVERAAAEFDGALKYLYVPTPGKPYALNAGIAATDGDLVGLIDDDEEVDAGWFEAIWRHLGESNDLDFIGGKCLPLWNAPRPPWLGTRYLGVIGWVDPGPDAMDMDESYPGILMGGNAVIRRDVLQSAGPYSTALNRTGTKLLGCEDEDMYHRLLARGARGRYVPDLVIYHHIPIGRLTKRYFRRWCFWRGVSLGIMDRSRPAPVTYAFGVPRYMIGRALRGIVSLTGHLTGVRHEENPAVRFEQELASWDLAGFAWGRHGRRKEPASVKVIAFPAPPIDREHVA